MEIPMHSPPHSLIFLPSLSFSFLLSTSTCLLSARRSRVGIFSLTKNSCGGQAGGRGERGESSARPFHRSHKALSWMCHRWIRTEEASTGSRRPRALQGLHLTGQPGKQLLSRTHWTAAHRISLAAQPREGTDVQSSFSWKRLSG